jgi:Ca2+-binding RTX toxin-like protein
VGGTGVDGADFVGGVLPSGTVTFLAGETSKTLTITVAGDTVFESDEAFTVTLTNPSAGSAITTASAGGIILNDDIFNDVRVVLFGTKSADVIDVGAEGLPHEIDALQGNDSVTGTAFDDLITGGKGRDTLIGDAGDDTFLVSGTGDGEDLIYGGDGYDVILGSAGKDTIYLRGLTASHSIEEINGGGGVNTLAGSSGSDVLDLSGTLLVNIDLVDGGKGHDHIIGTAFDDLIMGGPGRDTLIGGGGIDTAIYSGNINSYKIAVDGNQATVVDLIGKEATDYLTDFSYLQFSDATFDLTGGSGIASSEALARTVSNGEGSPLTFDDVLESGTGPASDGGREATALANNYDPLAPVNLNLSGDELLSAAGF